MTASPPLASFVVTPLDSITPYQVCDILTTKSIVWLQPHYNFRTQEIEFATNISSEIWNLNQTSGFAVCNAQNSLAHAFTNFDSWIRYWETNALPDKTPAQVVPLTPGDNLIVGSTIAKIVITIAVIGKQVDRWYGGNNIMKLGCVFMGWPEANDMHFINAQTTHWLPGAGYARFDGALINLQPNCSGVASVYNQVDFPQLQYSPNGGSTFYTYDYAGRNDGNVP